MPIPFLISCSMNPGIDNKVNIYDVPILETPEEISDFVLTFDGPINDYFYEIAVSFNRVNTLFNNTFLLNIVKQIEQVLFL